MVSAFKPDGSIKVDSQHLRPLDSQGLPVDAHKVSMQQLKSGSSDPGASLTSVLPPSSQSDAPGLHGRPLSPSHGVGGYYHQGGGGGGHSAPTSPSLQAAGAYPSMSSAVSAASTGVEPPRRNSVPILSSASNNDRKRVPSSEGSLDYHGFRAGPTPPGYSNPHHHHYHGAPSSQSYSSWGNSTPNHTDQYNYYRDERTHSSTSAPPSSHQQHSSSATGYYHIGGPTEYRGAHEDMITPAHFDHHGASPYSYGSNSATNGNEYSYPPSSSSSSSSSSSHGGGGSLHRHNSLPTGLNHSSHHHHPHHAPPPHPHHHAHHPPLPPSQMSSSQQQSPTSQSSSQPLPPMQGGGGHHGQQANKHPCKFPNCGWSFKRYEHLKRHMLVHTKERPFVCDFQGCEKSFSRSDNFSAHLRTHTKKTQQMRRFDRGGPMMDSAVSFRGGSAVTATAGTGVGLGMGSGGGGLPMGGIGMGVGSADHHHHHHHPAHHRHSIAGYPPSYAGARSPLEGGPIDPYAQGRDCFVHGPNSTSRSAHSSYCGPSSSSEKSPFDRESFGLPSHDHQQYSSSGMHPLDSPTSAGPTESSSLGCIVPRFNTIKLDLKAVSNNPDDVHLHNLHNPPPPRPVSASSNGSSSYNEFGRSSSFSKYPTSETTDIKRPSSSSPGPTDQHDNINSLRHNTDRGDDQHPPPPSTIHYQDRENSNPSGESPTPASETILAPLSMPSSGRSDVSALSFPVATSSHSIPTGAAVNSSFNTASAVRADSPVTPDQESNYHRHHHHPLGAGPGGFQAVPWTEPSSSSHGDGYLSASSMRMEETDHKDRYHAHYDDEPKMMMDRHHRGYLAHHPFIGSAYDHNGSAASGGYGNGMPPSPPSYISNDFVNGGGLRHGSISSSASSSGGGGFDASPFSPTDTRMNLQQRFGGGGGMNMASNNRSRGTSTAVKNHCCTVPGCLKRFKRLEHLKRHIKTHTLERPFHCNAVGCNKRFSRSDNLSQHIKTHQRQLMNKVHWKHRPM